LLPLEGYATIAPDFLVSPPAIYLAEFKGEEFFVGDPLFLFINAPIPFPNL